MRYSAGCLVLTLSLLAATSVASPLQIDVNAGAAVRPVNPRLFGSNLEPKDQTDQATRDLLGTLGLSLYRFPGGGWPGWHWQTGTFDNQSEFNSCALADINYLKGLMAALAGEVLVQVNVESGTATEAAGLLAWMRANGLTGEYFELGNEVYGDWDAGYRSASAYVTTIRQFAAALRPQDPHVLVGADVGGGPYDSWDRAVVAGACSDIDFLSFHWYPGRQTTETAAHVMGNSVMIPWWVQHFRQLLADTCAARKDHIEIGFLEWDGVFDHDTTGMRQTLANAIFYADALGQMATAGVALSTHYETAGRNYGLVDGYDACWSWPDRFTNKVRPKAYALQLASKLAGGDLVATTVSGAATYTTSTQSPEWEYSGAVPYQAAYASRHADHLTLLIVSRHPDQATPATINLNGFTPRPTADVLTLTGPSLTASNETTTGTVGVTPSTVNVGPSFTFSVPPRSVVLLQIGAQGSAADGGVASGPDAAASHDAGVPPQADAAAASGQADAAAAGGQADAAVAQDAPITPTGHDASVAVDAPTATATDAATAGGDAPGSSTTPPADAGVPAADDAAAAADRDGASSPAAPGSTRTGGCAVASAGSSTLGGVTVLLLLGLAVRPRSRRAWRVRA
ncbi:MAG TPA: alpha-L-arabinofuranosidase C-terminal domain-containing protein [Polyangia bacterium]|jgi:hypothetical protein